MSAAFGEHLLIDIAQRHDLDRRNLNETEQIDLAVPAAADQADARRLAIGEGGVGGLRQSESGRAGGQEITSIHGGISRRAKGYERGR